MGFIAYDLESIPDPALPSRSEQDFPPPAHHQVVCIGVGFVSLEKSVVKLTAFVKDERRILGRFVCGSAFDEPERTHQRQAPGHSIVSFNGRKFDAPVLVARCMKHRLPWPWYWRSRGARNRYGDVHIDLYDELTEYGAALGSGLDTWSRLVGQAGKNGNGANVEQLAATGNWDAIGRYCCNDVKLTIALLLRWLLVRGRIGVEREAEMLGLLDAAEPEIVVLEAIES